MESINTYSPTEYAREDLIHITADVISENKGLKIRYMFYVDDDNGTLKHTYMSFYFK